MDLMRGTDRTKLTSARGFTVYRWWLTRQKESPLGVDYICPVKVNEEGEVLEIMINLEKEGREPSQGWIVGTYRFVDNKVMYQVDEWALDLIKSYGV